MLGEELLQCGEWGATRLGCQGAGRSLQSERPLEEDRTSALASEGLELEASMLERTYQHHGAEQGAYLQVVAHVARGRRGHHINVLEAALRICRRRRRGDVIA